MSETLFEARPRSMDAMRVHDYLYDSAFIVSGARDYARTAFKAAMDSAQVSLQPVYKFMFSELRMFPRMQVVYYPNCRLPEHIDRSYAAYLVRQQESRMLPTPQLAGRDQYKFTARPKKVLDMPSVTPAFHPASPVFAGAGLGEPRSRGTQSRYRESSAQTIPWQPDAKPAPDCENVPEVMYLDKLEWGPGKPYRIGDLPADFHTTEIINKMRHARKWNELVEKAEFPRWMKRRDQIISDVETKDWIFREAEIDELQDIRLELLHRLQAQQRTKQNSRTSRKLAQLWAAKKKEMETRIDHIRKTRDRELRKLSALHAGGGRGGMVQRMRAARGAGSVTRAAAEPTSDLHAPVARHGYQARRRHADIYYDPSLLALEDHEKIAEPPAWLENCGQDLKRSCSGHHLPRDPMKLCERETKWSEQFLENLHNDLKKARLGATATAGPLRVLKPRRHGVTPRPSTPEADMVQPDDELCHQAALTLQRIIRGRAVQILMYEGRTRAAELTEELKTTHGLQREDKIHIAKEEARARDHHVIRTDADQKEEAITALVDELCGGAVSAALDFLEKELRRLKEERRQHAFILIALREKVMREAAEAGRRQKEEHRRREHDEMFKQVLGVTQETVDAYFRDIVQQGVELAAEEEAVRRAENSADRVDRALLEDQAMSTAEQNELVAELVQQFLLPATHKCASRHRISSLQQARTEAARQTIFGVIDDAEIKEPLCIRCGQPLGELCRCRVCPVSQEPVETQHRHDRRWRYTRGKPHTPEKTYEERFPIQHDVRCMLNELMEDVVVESRRRISDELFVSRDCGERLKELVEVTLDAKDTVAEMVSIAVGETEPSQRRDYRHYSRRIRPDAFDRTEAVIPKCLCPEDLPSEIRARAEEEARRLDPTCYCEPDEPTPSRVRMLMDVTPDEKMQLLPSELRALEDLKRCKCNAVPTPATETTYEGEEEMTEEMDNTTDYADTYNSSDV